MKNKNLLFNVYSANSIVLDVATREILKVICPCYRSTEPILVLQKEDGSFVNRNISFLCRTDAPFNNTKNISINSFVEGANPYDKNFGKTFVVKELIDDFAIVIQIPREYISNSAELEKDLEWLLAHSPVVTLPLYYIKVI